MNQASGHEADLSSAEKLHTSLIDAIHGYDEAIEHAEADVKADLVAMKRLHTSDEGALAAGIRAQHGEASKEGSWMSTVQETVMNVRAWLTGIDDGVLPAVIRGERSLLDQYATAIGDTGMMVDLNAILRRQRAGLEAAVKSLESQVA